MELKSLSKQIAEWMTKEKGLFVFSTKFSDEWIYKGLIDHILSHVNCNTFTDTYKPDLSHTDRIEDSIFIDNLMDMRYDWATDKSNDYQLHKKIVSEVREKLIRQNNTQVIFTPLYESFGSNNSTTPNNTSLTGGSSIVFMADFIGIIYQNHFSIQKCRWQNSDDFSDVDLRVLFRDQKIDTILK